MGNNTANRHAVELLDQAGQLYPSTREEALRMQALTAQAWDAAEDRGEEEFKEKYEQISDIVEWSLTRHRTWLWPLIVGTLLFAGLLFWGGVSNKDGIESAKESIRTIQAWEPCDTVITWETCAYPASDAESMADWRRRLENANRYKAYHLGEAKRRYLQNQETVASYKKKAETETDPEKKEGYLKQVTYWEKTLVSYRAQFDELAPMHFKGVQEKALEGSRSVLSSDRFIRNFLLINFILVLILTGLYIWTGNPYGYEITRARTRNKILGWIRKIGFWFVGITLGAGIVQKIFADDIVWEYSDGHRESETDIAGTSMNIILKIGLIAVGLVAFMALSGFLMFIETAFGLPAKLRERK